MTTSARIRARIAKTEADMICIDCGSILTDEESHYYEFRCEGCEREAHERVVRWREGAEGPEMDRRFDAPPVTLH